MPVESAEDRAALIDDFGIAVRLSPDSGPFDVLALLDGPTREAGGVATELDFLEPSTVISLQTEKLADTRVGTPVEILEGARKGSYIARAPVAEDDGEFSRIELAEA